MHNDSDSEFLLHFPINLTYVSSAAMLSFLGHFSFVRSRIPDNFHRNILGGCLFVVAKDLAGLFGTYQELKRKRVRRIREYAEFKDERQ